MQDLDARNALVAQAPFAAFAPAEGLAALATICQLREVPRGTLITLEGEPATAMFLVAEGRIKVVRHSPEGREQILHIVEPVDHFNTVPMFDRGPCPATTEALLPSQLLVIEREALVRTLHEHPSLGLALLGDLAGRMRRLVGLVETLALHTVNGRLARLLLDQARAAEAGNPPPPLTQADMAARIGSVREMVGRALKAFEVAGFIELNRGAITIVDAERLAEQAEQ